MGRCWRCRSPWRPCFSSRAYSKDYYRAVLREMDLIAKAYPGWTLEEIRGLSRRERVNWLEMHFKRGG